MKHAFARKLRRDQTTVERKLWNALRDRRFAGYKFRRQQPVGPYIVDFVCFDARLIVELDGGQHSEEENRAADEKRTARLMKDGFRVRRFWNSIVAKEFDAVLNAIYRDLTDPSPASAFDGESELGIPLPRGEREY